MIFGSAFIRMNIWMLMLLFDKSEVNVMVILLWNNLCDGAEWSFQESMG